MKRYLTGVLLFFLAVAVIDQTFGAVCGFFSSHAVRGYTRSLYYSARECDSDILILGSSRAVHHYDPVLLGDSLGLSCHNAGIDGNGIVLQYPLLRMLTERHVPRVVIYEIYPSFDILEGDNLRFLGLQRRFCDNPAVREVIDLVQPLERLKLLSGLYRYNGDFVQMLADQFGSPRAEELSGFLPVNRKLHRVPDVHQEEPITVWDPVKLECMERLIKLCREQGILLVFSLSPKYGGVRPSTDELIYQLAAEHHVPLIDYYSDSAFCMCQEYFYDAVHLNATGAQAYTSVFASELAAIIDSINELPLSLYRK